MRRAGFTLIELMIVAAVLGVILMMVFGTMTTSQRKAQAIEDSVDLQQQARQIASLIERDFRHTGFMVEDSLAYCGVDSTDKADEFYVSDWQVITPGVDLAPVLATTVVGAVNVPGNGSLVTVDTLVLETGTPDPAFDTNGDMVPDSDYRVDNHVIVADVANPGRGSACGRIVAVDAPNRIAVQLDSGGLGPVPVPGEVPNIVMAPAIRYSVDNNGNLFRGPLQLASGVEDIQIALFFDLDTDNVIDAGEYFGDGTGPDYTALGRDAGQLREVRVNVVLRGRTVDPDFAGYSPIATENRIFPAGTDGFRRRAYTAVVRLRNLGRRVQM